MTAPCKNLLNKISGVVCKPSLENIIKGLAGILVVVTLVGFIFGVIKTVGDLRLLVQMSVESGLRQMIVNILSLLALIEIIKTLMSYLSDGRVKVTYIVDTILILMLNEVSTFWLKGQHSDFVPLISILLTLIFIRILAVRFSPSRYGLDD